MSKYSMSISRVLGDAALNAQRQGWIRAFLPASARRRLSASTAGLIKRSTGELVDDWSRPLIGPSSRMATPTTAALPTEVVGPHLTGIHTTEAALPQRLRAVCSPPPLSTMVGWIESWRFLRYAYVHTGSARRFSTPRKC